MFFLKAEMVSTLPHDLKTLSEKVEDLETLRKGFGLSHEFFMMGIVISWWAVIKKQEAVLEHNNAAKQLH